jgi:hypothetical protein
VTAELAIAETRAWVERAVIGLNLCPFAKAPQAKGRIRYVSSEATDVEALRADLTAELKLLASTPESRVETTLLIHPHVLGDFLDYNDFLGVAEDAVALLDLAGEIQVASFHPHYRFAGSEPDDPVNATNRSPYPTLHLLREAGISRAVAAFPEAASIFEANIATMRQLGAEDWATLQRRCHDDAVAAAVSASPTRTTKRQSSS